MTRARSRLLALGLACLVALGAFLAGAPAASAATAVGNCSVPDTPTPSVHAQCAGLDLGTGGAYSLDFDYADLSGTSSYLNNFSYSSFRSADLSGAHWHHNGLIGADLTGAAMVGVDLTDGLDTNAIFDGVDLTGSDLSTTALSGSSFLGATLDGVNFTGTVLSPAPPAPVVATGPSGAVVTWATPSALPGATPGSCDHPSGSLFPVGSTLVTCSVDDDHGTFGAAEFEVTVLGVAPQITSSPTTTFVVGRPGSFAVTTSGAPVASITYTGALPAGVTLVDNGNGTATLAGTPATGTSGAYVITLAATNGVNPVAGQPFVLQVDQVPAFTSAASATFTAGSAGSFTVATAGRPAAAITAAGALPSGVTLVDNGNGTATLAGVPAAGTGGTYPITLQAANGVAPDATQAFVLTVDEAPAFTSSPATTFVVGTAASFTITTSGVPGASISTTGALPAGVTFVDHGDGTAALSGTPAADTGGSYPITLQATNGVAPDATQALVLTVDQAPAFTSADRVTLVAGEQRPFVITTSGFPKPTVAAATLPAGVTLTDHGDGTATLAGTPTTAGVVSLTLTASNGVDPDAVQTLVVTVLPPLVITAKPPSATVGVAYRYVLTATGGEQPHVWSMSPGDAPPPGLTLAADGTLSGTPTEAGTFRFAVTVDDPVTATLTLVVAPAPGSTPTGSVRAPTGSAGAPTGTTAGRTTLAGTGADQRTPLVAGLLALALGGALLGLGSRRRRAR